MTFMKHFSVKLPDPGNADPLEFSPPLIRIQDFDFLNTGDVDDDVALELTATWQPADPDSPPPKATASP